MDKLECLKISDIGQSAAKPLIEERSTTISKESTSLTRGKRVVYQRSVIYQIKNTVNQKIYIGSASWYEKRKGTHIAKLRKKTHNNPHLQSAWNKYGENCFEFSILEEVPVLKLIQREQHYFDLLKPEYNIAKIAGSNLGLKMKEESKRKISSAFKGVPKSRELRQKFKEVQTLLNGKKVIEINSNTTFNSISEASKISGISVAAISKQCSKKINGRKYTFRYKDIV